MKMNDLYPSNWLKKEDVQTPVTATIRAVTQETIKGERGNELKAVLHFVGNMKPMILNKSNASVICAIYGDDTVNWSGKQIEVYCDPTVMFGGKPVGGIKLRAPQSHSAPNRNGTAPLTFAQAQQQLEQVGIGKDELLAAVKAAGIKNTNDPAFAALVRKLKNAKLANEQGGELDGSELEQYVDESLGQIPF